MRMISPNGSTFRVSEMAFKAASKDFEGAEKVAKTLGWQWSKRPSTPTSDYRDDRLGRPKSKRAQLQQQQAQQQVQGSDHDSAQHS